MLTIYFSMVGVPLLLVAAILGTQHIGVKLRQRHHTGAADLEGLGVIDAAVFGLMGLLLAMAFSGAMGRFDDRRKLVVQETNDIGTAWLRVDLLPSADQPRMRELLRAYVDSRLITYSHMGDAESLAQEAARSSTLQAQIWSLAVPSAAS